MFPKSAQRFLDKNMLKVVSMFPKSAQRILDKNMFKVCEHVPKKCAADFGQEHV
jgi:hypothetical protein